MGSESGSTTVYACSKESMTGPDSYRVRTSSEQNGSHKERNLKIGGALSEKARMFYKSIRMKQYMSIKHFYGDI